MRNNIYNKEKIIDSLYNKGYTNFLNRNELNIVKRELKQKEYNIFELYENSTKVVLYRENIPNIKLYKISTYLPKKHQEILGTILSFGIQEDRIGDIIKYKDLYYVFILPEIEEYIKYNFIDIKGDKVELESVNLDLRNEFKIEYEELKIITSSLRIDKIVSLITNDSRNKVLDRFKNKEVIVNYNNDIKSTYLLKEKDVFSIRKYGKFLYNGIEKTTKSNNYIISILKYK